MSKPRIAYIMSRFPGLTETFILREMCMLETLGWKLDLYPLLFQNESVVHDDALAWMPRARRSPLFEILIANLKLIGKNPFVYISTWFRAVWGNIFSLKFLSRTLVLYPKAVWMARQMQDARVAHIHAHYATHPALVAWIINRITGIPYSVTVHAHDIFVDKSMLRAKMQNAAAIIAISHYNLEYLRSYLGDWVADKISVVHCGIDPDMYIAQDDSVSLNHPEIRILSIGSLRPYKGFTYLLDACVRLRERGLNFQCTIIGGGELQDFLQAKILKLNLQEHVYLAGPKKQNEVADFLKRSDCYVQPSIVTRTGKMEGIPVSLMEAMASGLPVVATNISGIPELVIPSETGYLVPPEDPVALANAISEICQSPGKARQIALSGREFVRREFDLAANVNILSQKFESLIEGASWK